MKPVLRAALTALLTCASLTVGVPSPAHAAPAQESVALHQGVAALAVAPEDPTGYHRETSFGGWTDADHDGCTTRAEVLLEGAVTAPEITGRCTLTGGQWFSWYDDTTVDDARALDIDEQCLASPFHLGTAGLGSTTRKCLPDLER